MLTIAIITLCKEHSIIDTCRETKLMLERRSDWVLEQKVVISFYISGDKTFPRENESL